MALSADDRLLGEKTHYYCSSSEEEEEVEDPVPAGIEEPDPLAYQKGYSTNTGPKGVINDWRRFKQLETEKRIEQETEKLQLAHKLSLTCRTEAEDAKNKEQDEEFMCMLEGLDDEFMKDYRKKRLEEMRKVFDDMPRFGKVCDLSKSMFLEAIDKERSTVTIIIHVYEEGVSACEAMAGCLRCLAHEYPTVKFCRIRASETTLSHKFAASGVPALLVYKNKEMIGNFVRLSDELGSDFFATDVESFLHEHGMLPETNLLPATIHAVSNNDDDSDFDID